MSKRSLKAVLLSLALTPVGVIAQPTTWDDAAFIDDEWSMAITLEDPKQRYFYFPPRTDFGVPAAGYALVVVLPGGPGGASQRPYYKDVYLNAMPVDFMMAQLLSVKWSPEQRIVWPTKKITDVQVEFTTPEFITAVIDDVRGRVRIDPQRIILMGASSSGGAVMTAALTNTDVSGALLTASVFREHQLPPMRGAADKRFFLVQGVSDDITPFHYAQTAAQTLSRHGADVRLYAMPGGHHPGWPNNYRGVYGYAFHWLQGDHNSNIERRHPPQSSQDSKFQRRFRRH